MTDEKVNQKHNLFFSQRLIRNSFYTGLALGFVGIIPFAFNFLVARSFGKEILGSINITLSFCLIITIFVTNFFGSAGNKYLAEYRGSQDLEHFQFVFKIMIGIPIIILSIIAGLLSWNWAYISNNFSLPSNLLWPVILYIFLRSFYILFRRALYGIDLVKAYAVNEIISDIIMLFAIGYVTYNNQSSLLIECYILCYSIFSILSINTLVKKYNSIKATLTKNNHFNPKDVIQKFINYGIVSMVGTVASTGTGYLSVLIIGVYLSNSDAGIYSSVLSIVSILMFVPKLFTQVFLPEFSKLFGEGDRSKILQIFKQSIWLMLAISTTVCLLLFLFSGNILSLFGQEFSTGSTILNIILPSVFIRMVSIPFVSFLSGTKYVIYPNIGGIVILVTSLIFWIIFVPKFHLVGIALGYTIGIIVGIGYQIIIAIVKIKSFNIKS